MPRSNSKLSCWDRCCASARQSGSGWLGGGEDSSAECATDYAEQQFAAVLASKAAWALPTWSPKGTRTQSR